jgi:hypothetical protein
VALVRVDAMTKAHQSALSAITAPDA